MATKLPAKKHTDEIDCEIASQIISDYFAHTAKALAAERRCSGSDAKIHALECLLADLHREKLELSVENTTLIKKTFDVYARKLKDSRS
jgi:hypothetical protein